MKATDKKPIILNILIIALCFLLTSTGYLTWAYNLTKLASPLLVDSMTLVAGYVLQAAGLGLFSFLLHRIPVHIEKLTIAALILQIVWLAPAAISSSLIVIIITGLLMNMMCGMIAGYYLYRLTCDISAGSSAITLGAGYAISIIASWLLSFIGRSSVYYTGIILAICLILTVALVVIIRLMPQRENAETISESVPASSVRNSSGALLPIACLLVLIFSIVNSIGFGMHSGELLSGINLEFSRLFYAAGLLIAGFVTDRDRRYGGICAMTALVIPFIMLALKDEPISLIVFWALSYFTFGFYSVYRMILFSDIARDRKWMYLAGMGLLIGRIGDAAGEGLCLVLSSHYMTLIVLSGIMFIVAVFLFFRIYHALYIHEDSQQKSEREHFNTFAMQHDLSSREREVLFLLLEEKSNTEIAEALSVSESTVKFHIHNLLQKTGCKNRVALIAGYNSGK